MKIKLSELKKIIREETETDKDEEDSTELLEKTAVDALFNYLMAEIHDSDGDVDVAEDAMDDIRQKVLRKVDKNAQG